MNSSSELTPHQLDKYERVRKYLSLSVPNEWKTLAELDAIISQGALLTKFPFTWVRELQAQCGTAAYGLQIRMPTTISGAGKEGISLRFHALRYGTSEQLLEALNSPEYSSGSSKSAAQSMIGLNTQDVSQVDPTSESIIRSAIRRNVLFSVMNSSGGAAKRLRRAAGDTLGGGNDDEDDPSSTLRSFDGGRSELAQWMSQSPIKIIRSTVKTSRGVVETSYGSNVPMNLKDGEEMEMVIQRLGGASLGQGAKVTVTLMVNNTIPVAGMGLTVEPVAMEFTSEGQSTSLRWRANKKGQYILSFRVAVAHEGGSFSADFDRLKVTVSEVFNYSHAINSYVLAKADVIEGQGLIQPGGVLLFRQDPFPIVLPKDYCLSVYPSIAASTSKAPPSTNPTAAVAKPQWWCDASSHINSFSARADAAEIKACASRIASGAFIFSNPAVDSNGGSDSVFRDADGNLDVAKVQVKQFEDSRKIAERAKEAAARRTKNKRKHKELTNRHLLNYGIDLRKPYKPQLQ